MASKGKFAVLKKVGKSLPLGKSLIVLGMVTFVSATAVNAVFLQSGKHPAVLFAMRPDAGAQTELRADELALPAARPVQQEPDRPVTRIVFDRGTDAETETDEPSTSLPAPAVRKTVSFTPDSGTPTQNTDAVAPANTLSNLQEMLARLGYYNDAIDGLSGPKTLAAIEAYKADVGLQGIDLTIEELATSARNNLIVTAAIPANPPEPRPEAAALSQTEAPNEIAAVVSPAPPVKPQDRKVSPLHDPAIVKKVQAGLKSFTMSDMTVDGVFGSETEKAISEFQKLFRLPVTGEIDDELLRKMDAFGLIQK